MTGKLVLSFLISTGLTLTAFTQNCSTLGQTPGTAFPVCGTSDFKQQTVPACGGKLIPVPGCNDGAQYSDINPYWYKFTCFSSGTLGFTITPLTASDDYDWQLFDITGRSPEEVYTKTALYITSNWSAVPGTTGTSANAASITNCSGFSYPNKSKMPQLIAGHQYLLLVSHFTTTNQSGYTLSFGGGTANITDPKLPALDSAVAYCDGSKVILTLNKKMRCNTIAANGSDFRLTTPLANVIGASSSTCSTSFDMDTLTVMLSNPLPPGTYTLVIQKGTDANTILDNCDRGIPENDSINFTVVPVAPTPMDSITQVGCSPSILELAFQKPMRCNSIAGDGSDFIISGNPGISVSSAFGSCSSDNLSSIIYIKLNQPITQKGNFSIILKRGSDGNTIIDECGEETPMGSQLNFSTMDTVSAAFNYNILWGCSSDTIRYSHPGGNDIKSWIWAFGNNDSSNTRDTEKIYSVFGQKNTSLIVSNGVCADTASESIMLDNELSAAFDAPEFVCPNDTTQFTDASIGKIVSWAWDFGNGARSLSPTPAPQQYPAPITDREYTVKLTVTDSIGCFSQASHNIKAVSSCYIAIPSAFTPNGDNLNDYLYPLNAYKAEDLIFRVYNLYGQKIFETQSRFNKWDGTFKGRMQQPGTFVWTLHYIHSDTKRVFNLKGTTTLIR